MQKKILEYTAAAVLGLAIAIFICFAYAKYDIPTWGETVSTSKHPDYIEVKRDTVVTNLVKEPETPAYKYYLTDAEEEDLCRIAQAEAEDQGVIGKALVIRVVINRMEQRGMCIYDVIRQTNPVQFTAYANGSFNKAVPDQECFDALQMIINGWDESWGAQYFESAKGETWHSRNLDYLFTYKDHKFYREKGE